MRNRSLFCLLLVTAVPAWSAGGLPYYHKQAASVRGVVLYPNGKPAAGARVFRYRRGNPTGLQGGAISGPDGGFVLDDLDPGTAYSVCASKAEEGYLDPFFLPFGLATGGRCQDVMPQVGFNAGKIVLTLAPKAGTLSGRILDALTRRSISRGKVTLYRPLKLERDVWVLVDAKSATWIPSVVKAPDETGQFSFTNLPEGQYLLKVESEGYNTWFYLNQSSESSAKPLHIASGLSRKVLVALEHASRNQD